MGMTMIMGMFVVMGMVTTMARLVAIDGTYRILLSGPGDLYIMGIGTASASITHFL